MGLCYYDVYFYKPADTDEWGGKYLPFDTKWGTAYALEGNLSMPNNKPCITMQSGLDKCEVPTGEYYIGAPGSTVYMLRFHGVPNTHRITLMSKSTGVVKEVYIQGYERTGALQIAKAIVGMIRDHRISLWDLDIVTRIYEPYEAHMRFYTDILRAVDLYISIGQEP